MPLKMVNVTGEALVAWLTSREWGVAACYQCLNLDMSVSQPSGMPSFAILNACQNSLWATESLTSLSENKFRDRLWSFLLEQKKLSQIIPSMARISKSWKMHNSETIIRRHPYWTSAKVSWFSDVLLLCLHFTQPITAVRRVRKISNFFQPLSPPFGGPLWMVVWGWYLQVTMKPKRMNIVLTQSCQKRVPDVCMKVNRERENLAVQQHAAW